MSAKAHDRFHIPFIYSYTLYIHRINRYCMRFRIAASGSLFAVTVCLAVWKYGDNTTVNILEAVPSGSVANIAALLAALQLCFSSVIGYSALFQHLEDRWNVQRGKRDNNFAYRDTCVRDRF